MLNLCINDKDYMIGLIAESLCVQSYGNIAVSLFIKKVAIKLPIFFRRMDQAHLINMQITTLTVRIRKLETALLNII